MSECTSPEVNIDTSVDVVVEVPVETPVVVLLGSSSEVTVVKSGAVIEINGNPADEQVEVHTSTKGDKGDKGDQGNRGLRGDRGVPGPEGIRGRDGEQGLRGFRGPMGNAGNTGAQGTQGPPGEIDSELLLELVQPMLNEAAIIPIAEIREDIEALPGNILGSFLGDLSGDDVTDMTWSAGEDDSHFVGSVTTVSMISDKDYSSMKRTTGMIAKVNGSMAAIRVEQQVIAEVAYATANQLTTFVAETGDNVATLQQQLSVTTSQAYATATALEQLSAVTPEALAEVVERVDLLADDVEAAASSLTSYIAAADARFDTVDGQIVLLEDGQESTNLNVASLQETIEVHADQLSAQASQLLSLSASVGDQTADITELYELVADVGTGELEANYQLKTQVTDGDKVVMTGMALGAAIGENGGYRSEIIFMADTIGFMTKNTGVVHQPFVFDVANDTARLNNVFIGNASITTAMIEDAAITNAKFGGYLQSTTFNGNPSTNNPGTAGWYIGKDGKLYLNSIYARGNIEATSLKADVANIVSTLNIQGNAVTVPLGAEWTGSAFTSSGWVTGTPQGNFGVAPVMISCNIVLAYTADYPWGVIIRIFRNGSLIRSVTVGSLTPNEYGRNDSFSYICMDNPGVGNHSYQIGAVLQNVGAASITSASITVLGVKR